MPIRYSDQSDLFDVERAPGCPRHELRRCLAPCAALCSEAAYRRQVDQAGRFLEGDADEPLQNLNARMDEAAARWEFEHAASIRDRIAKLEMLRAEFIRLRETLGNLTFLYAVPGYESDHRVYAIRAGSIRGVYPAPRSRRQRARLLDETSPHLTRPEAPSDAVSRDRVEQILLVAHWFRTRPEQLERAYDLQRVDRLPLARQLDKLAVA